MEIAALSHPKADFIVPVVGIDSHSRGLVHSACSHNCSVLFFPHWGKFDEPCTEGVFEVPDIRGHN